MYHWSIYASQQKHNRELKFDSNSLVAKLLCHLAFTYDAKEPETHHKYSHLDGISPLVLNVDIFADTWLDDVTEALEKLDDTKPLPKIMQDMLAYLRSTDREQLAKDLDEGLTLKQMCQKVHDSAEKPDKDDYKELEAGLNVMDYAARLCRHGLHPIKYRRENQDEEVEFSCTNRDRRNDTILPDLFYRVIAASHDWGDESYWIDHWLEVRNEKSSHSYMNADYFIDHGAKALRNATTEITQAYLDDLGYPCNLKKIDHTHRKTNERNEKPEGISSALEDILTSIVTGTSPNGKTLYPCPRLSDLLNLASRMEKNEEYSSGSYRLSMQHFARVSRRLMGFNSGHRLPKSNRVMQDLFARSAQTRGHGADQYIESLIPGWVGSPTQLPCHLELSHSSDEELGVPEVLQPPEILFDALEIGRIASDIGTKLYIQRYLLKNSVTEKLKILAEDTVKLPLSKDPYRYPPTFYNLLRYDSYPPAEHPTQYELYQQDIEAYRQLARSQWEELPHMVWAEINRKPTRTELQQQAAFLQEHVTRLQQLGIDIAAIQEVIELTNTLTQETTSEILIDGATRDITLAAERPHALIHASTISMNDLTPTERANAIAALRQGADKSKLFADQLPQRHTNWDIIQEMHGKVHHQLEDTCTEALYIIDELIESGLTRPKQAQELMQLRERIYNTGMQAEPLMKRLREQQNTQRTRA